MTKTMTPYWRIYVTGKPYKLLGNVEATTEAEALEKAVKGIWKGFWATEADKPTSLEKLIAVI